MSEFYPTTINRSMILLLPRKPAYDWIMKVDPDQPKLTLDDIRQDCDGLLVPQGEVQDIEGARKWVYENWEMFLEEFLTDWQDDEETWPEKRTLKMFKDWFDIHYSSLVWDFVDEPIAHAIDEDDDEDEDK